MADSDRTFAHGNTSSTSGSPISRSPTVDVQNSPWAGVPAAERGPRGEPQVGTRLGKYLLTGKLGQGGEGVVYRALHPSLNISVAIKVIRTTGRDIDERVYRQFTAEARTLAQLNHPNIVRVIDFEDCPREPFLVMEFVEGFSLADVIAQSGRLSVERSLDIIYQVALGLEAAQRVQIIHRDIKPSNILLTKEGVAKIVDLGTALLLCPHSLESGQRRVVGTALYMPPEQFTGSSIVDHRSDIYALGGTLYHALTGRVPFPGRSPHEAMLLKSRVREDPSILPLPHEIDPQVPVAISDIIKTMLEPDPDDRYASYQELLGALCTITGAEVGTLPPLSASQHTTRSSRTSGTFRRVEVPAPSPPVDEVTLWLRGAAEAQQRGDGERARRLLTAARNKAPRNEQVWLESARLSATPAEAQELLAEGLGQLPGNERLLAAAREHAAAAAAAAARQPRKCPFCAIQSPQRDAACSNCAGYDSLNDPEVWFKAPPPRQEVFARAIAHYERIVRDKPEVRTHYILALSYLNARRFADAAVQLREVLKLRSDLTAVRGQLEVLDRHAQPPEPPRPRGPLVVVVDDSPTVRKMVALKLADYDYRVVTLKDGNEAVAQLATLRPDLVLLDINMPGKDGYQVCKWLKSQTGLKHIPVVMLSGADGFFDKIRGRMAGASRHISKPFDGDVLLQVVDMLCPRKSGQGTRQILK